MKQTAFGLDGKLHPIGLAKILNDKGELTGNPFWVSLDPDYMKRLTDDINKVQNE